MKKNRINKKPIIFILITLMLTVIGGTFAYYYSEVIIPNQFKAMTYNVQIEEEFYNNWGTKRVFIVNHEETNAPVVLRVNFNESWRKEIDGEKVSLDNNVNGINVVNKNWASEFTDNFIKGEDGWYYYKKILNAQESVQLLESIDLNEELIKTSPYYDDYKTYDYELSFNFESIQASSSAVKEIWNKEIIIDGDNVEWEL